MVSEIAKVPMEYHEDVARDIEERFPHLGAIREQCSFPKGAKTIKNLLGTAYGMVFSYSGTTFVFLPGVFREMEMMMKKEILPFIKREFPIKQRLFQKKIFFSLLTEMQVDPILREIQKEDPKIHIGIYPEYGTLKILFEVAEEKEKRAHERLKRAEERLLLEFSEYLFSSQSETIAEALHNTLIEEKKTLILAESCTGGNLSHKLTSFPRASDYLLGSVVCYSNEMKKKILNVSPETLKRHGAVSRETVEEMALGLFSLFPADFALSVSGTAGPSGGTLDKPVGTVFFALGEKGKIVDSGVLHSSYDRRGVIEYSSQMLLGIVLRYIKHQKKFIYG
jgi:nicotinamide-nucleotide amidase